MKRLSKVHRITYILRFAFLSLLVAGLLAASRQRLATEYARLADRAATNLKLPMREDVVTDGGDPAAVLANAPAARNGFFVVPKVVE